MRLLWMTCAVLGLGLWLVACSSAPSTPQQEKPEATQAQPGNCSTKPPKTQEKPTKPSSC